MRTRSVLWSCTQFRFRQTTTKMSTSLVGWWWELMFWKCSCDTWLWMGLYVVSRPGILSPASCGVRASRNTLKLSWSYVNMTLFKFPINRSVKNTFQWRKIGCCGWKLRNCSHRRVFCYFSNAFAWWRGNCVDSAVFCLSWACGSNVWFKTPLFPSLLTWLTR